MIANQARQVSRLAKVGWGILIAASALLLLHGIFWLFGGPELALENIAERTSLATSEFRVGSPSAFDVISLLNRNYAILELGLGAFAALVAWGGYRLGSRWAWRASGLLVASLAAMTTNFVLVGGLGGGSIGYVVMTAVALVGWLLARDG